MSAPASRSKRTIHKKPSKEATITAVSPYAVRTLKFDLYSNIQSGAFRLENGNTLITVTQQDLILEVNNDGEIIWQTEKRKRFI